MNNARPFGQRLLTLLLAILLSVSFWYSHEWVLLSGGLALFLFGMQCLDGGLRQLAGSRLESGLRCVTERPWKSLLFGTVATAMVQSSSLVSLLTIAFLSTGLIGLSAGICIIYGANLGTSSGVWLLALLGQSTSLSTVALPFAVFGILLGFRGPRGRGAGHILIGISLLFLGIGLMKDGVTGLTHLFDPASLRVPGLAGALLYAGIGVVVTALLQSSHASLMLTLTMLSGGQIDIQQAFALAIGANIGTTISAVLGALGVSARSGQRLALAHVLFNLVNGLLVIGFVPQLVQLSEWGIEQLLGRADLQLTLAFFDTLLKCIGLLLFMPWHRRFADWLERLLPERDEPGVLIAEIQPAAGAPAPVLPVIHARYLDDSTLTTAETAVQAVAMELQHLARLSLEVICHALYLPVSQLSSVRIDEQALQDSARAAQGRLDAEQLYQRHIKGVYGDLVSYMGRLEVHLDEAHNQSWVASQLVALQLVDAVKDAKHLQKNLGRLLNDGQEPAAQAAYLDLRRHLLWVLREMRAISLLEVPADAMRARLSLFDRESAAFDSAFRERLFADVREHKLDGLRASSLMNDLGYASRIGQSLRNVLLLGLGEAHDLLHELPFRAAGDEPLIQLPG